MLKQQSSRESHGVRYILWNIAWPELRVHPRALAADNLTPLTPSVDKPDSSTGDHCRCAARHGYIAICTAATINLPPSITALGEDRRFRSAPRDARVLPAPLRLADRSCGSDAGCAGSVDLEKGMLGQFTSEILIRLSRKAF